MPDITKKQAQRLAARVKGDSLATIAAAEGCSKQAVAKSLATPAVRVLGMELFSVNADTGETVDLVRDALKAVVNVMDNATRAVLVTESVGGYTTQRIQYVPDYATRLAAASRILSLADKQPAFRPTVAIEQDRETVTTHTRERQRVDIS